MKRYIIKLSALIEFFRRWSSSRRSDRKPLDLSMNFYRLSDSIRVIDIDNGVAMKFVMDFLLIQLKGNGIMAI